MKVKHYKLAKLMMNMKANSQEEIRIITDNVNTLKCTHLAIR